MNKLIAIACVTLALLPGIAAGSGHGAPSAAPAGPSPDQAIKMLQDGNGRFASGQVTHPRQAADRRVETVKNGQHPFVSVLSCADSRVPVETILDQGIGDVFVIRVAGNVADTDEIGTIEYGVGHLNTPLLVVLGHTRCGAVTAVVEGAQVGGCIAPLVSKIVPAANACKHDHPDLKGGALVAEVIRANVWTSVEDVFRRSEEVRHLVHTGKLKIVGGVYDLESGAVTWMGEHPRQEALLKAAASTHDAAPNNAQAHAAPDKHEPAKTAPAAVGSTGVGAYLVLGGAMFAVGFGVFQTLRIRRIKKKLVQVTGALTSGITQTASAASQVSASSQSLAQGASEQAAALEETSSSLEEMSSMTKKNAENAQQASSLAGETKSAADKGNGAMNKMSAAIGEIQKSATETAKIIKVIDEIAFQTNLLALNAAVEAARAGEAGKGFAVVAEEVRNLAMRSAEAAKNTASMIEESVNAAKNGVAISADVAKTLEEITGAATKVNALVGEIAAASNEQTQGIGQVNTAVSQMDKVTQSNAASAEESASAAEELAAQAEQLQGVIGELTALVSGKCHEQELAKAA